MPSYAEQEAARRGVTPEQAREQLRRENAAQLGVSQPVTWGSSGMTSYQASHGGMTPFEYSQTEAGRREQQAGINRFQMQQGGMLAPQPMTQAELTAAANTWIRMREQQAQSYGARAAAESAAMQFNAMYEGRQVVLVGGNESQGYTLSLNPNLTLTGEERGRFLNVVGSGLRSGAKAYRYAEVEERPGGFVVRQKPLTDVGAWDSESQWKEYLGLKAFGVEPVSAKQTGGKAPTITIGEKEYGYAELSDVQKLAYQKIIEPEMKVVTSASGGAEMEYWRSLLAPKGGAAQPSTFTGELTDAQVREYALGGIRYPSPQTQITNEFGDRYTLEESGFFEVTPLRWAMRTDITEKYIGTPLREAEAKYIPGLRLDIPMVGQSLRRG